MLGLNLHQSALHAYEASQMAASAPTVNKTFEISIASKDAGYHLSEAIPEVDGCPLSIKDLVSAFAKYGPRGTQDFGVQAISTIKDIAP